MKTRIEGHGKQSMITLPDPNLLCWILEGKQAMHLISILSQLLCFLNAFNSDFSTLPPQNAIAQAYHIKDNAHAIMRYYTLKLTLLNKVQLLFLTVSDLISSSPIPFKDTVGQSKKKQQMPVFDIQMYYYMCN